MINAVNQAVDRIQQKVVAYRRDFHRYAEPGWMEFRTASLVARRLHDLGYTVQAGRQVLCTEERLGLPPPQVLADRWQRALQEEGDRAYLEVVKGGYTGVVGVLEGSEGPTVGLRFDMDALEAQESTSSEHLPAHEGFASLHAETMHACGHDAHTAIGLGVAEVLASLREELQGRVKLIFQPAEEGVRGARAMVWSGVVDDVDYLIGHHLRSGWATGEISCGVTGYLATTKFDAMLTGQAAHAGSNPQEGKNALLAAATAILNLYAIARHRDGATRINVGQVEAGTGRNVISPSARLAIETRGATAELNNYVYERAVRVLNAAAQMYECTLKLEPMGGAQGASSDPRLVQYVEQIATTIGGFALRPPEKSGGSEDFTYMMERVQERGGLATSIIVGADRGGWGHHTSRFDIDENAFSGAMKLLAVTALSLAGSELIDCRAEGCHRGRTESET